MLNGGGEGYGRGLLFYDICSIAFKLFERREKLNELR